MNKKTTAIIAVVAVLAIVLAGLTIKKIKSVSPVPVGGNTLLTPWGYVALSEVEGEDLECVGKYDDLVRVYYDEQTFDDEEDITIGYYKEGDVFDKAESYFTQKLEECGYQQLSKSQGTFSVPGLKVLKYASYEYTKNDEEDVEITMGVVEYQGNTYTLVEITYSKYAQEASNSQSNENTASESQQQAIESVPQDIKPYDDFMKDILDKVFGEVKLSYYGTANFGSTLITLTYSLPRAIESEDINVIAKEMNSKGYQTIGTQADLNSIEGVFSLSEENKMISINGVVGNKELEVTITVSSQ